MKVFSSKEKQRDNAITMLAAIDANAGGKLMASGKEPTDFAIASALANRPMILLLRVWESEDKQKLVTMWLVFSVVNRQKQHLLLSNLHRLTSLRWTSTLTCLFNLDLNDGAIRGPFYSRGYYESTA